MVVLRNGKGADKGKTMNSNSKRREFKQVIGPMKKPTIVFIQAKMIISVS